VGQAQELFLLPGVVPDAATGTWWLCWPRRTAPGGSAGQSGSGPVVLGGSVGPGELLQEVAQGRVGGSGTGYVPLTWDGS
jgi:hypothetical protein